MSYVTLATNRRPALTVLCLQTALFFFKFQNKTYKRPEIVEDKASRTHIPFIVIYQKHECRLKQMSFIKVNMNRFLRIW